MKGIIVNPLITRRALATIAAVGLFATALAGCNRDGGASGSDSTGDSKATGAKVVLAVSTLNNPFFVTLRDGAVAQAEAKGISLDVSDAQNDAATQGNQLATAQAIGAKAVIVNPVDSDAVSTAVQRLVSANIPIIAVDRGVTGAKVSSFISSDNVAGGRQAAEALAKAMGEKGKVLILQGVPGTSASRDRGQGFAEGIKAFSNIQVVAQQTASFDRTQGLNVTSNLMQANPDVTGIFAENDEMALGAIQALGARAGKDVLVFGFDGTPDGLEAIQDGRMVGSIAQQPAELGKLAVDQAVNAINGDPVDETVPVPVTSVTKDNVAEFIK